jgi:pilus assembly protein FimV
MSHLHRLLLVILLGAMQPSLAMQLGASKGSAVFGRPLDLTIPVRFDTTVEDPFNCFSAEVFQADAKFDAGRVRIDVTPASNGLDAVVRIRSNTAVVEPWAKVILRNNCGAKVTRQYDFLTDFVADLPAIASQTESVANNNLPTTTIVGDTSTKQNTQAATVSNALPLLPSAPVTNWSVKRAQSSTQATNQASVPAPTKPRRTLKLNAVEPKPTAIAAASDNALGKIAPMSQSRLKMETFELTDEHQVLLKLSTAMIAPSATRTPEEIQALAQATAVWRAINGMPAVAAATVAQPAPPLANAPAVAAVRTMQSAIVKDGKYEFSNPIVYGLMGLLALTLACIAWLWFQVRRRTQLGYSWLEETALTEAPMQTEPPQVTQRWSTDTTFVPEDQIDEFVELTSTETEKPHEQLAEAALDASPLEALKSIKDTLTLQKNKTSPKIKAKEKETKEFSAANPPEKSPEHFDDSRFDEQQLITKFNTSLVQEDVINALNESVDFVVPDATPKLRSVPSPVLPVESEMELEIPPATPQIVSVEPQQASTNLPKKELPKDLAKDLPKDQASASKGNLIDFDVFAEQAPLPKPSRFSR